jgi:hypothetical protein
MRLLAPFAVAAAMLFAASCNDSEHDHHDHGALSETTRIASVDGYEVVFDFVSMADHHKMMELMKLKMDHDPAADRHLSVTIIEKRTGAQISNAAVNRTVYTPDGRVVSGPGVRMAGEGMVHWGLDVKSGGPGTYRVAGDVKIGERNLAPLTEFILK